MTKAFGPRMGRNLSSTAPVTRKFFDIPLQLTGIDDFDRTGHSWHGDYLFGWKEGVLQKALDARCTGDACTTLKTQSAATANACMQSKVVQEQTEGCKCQKECQYPP